MVSIGNALSDGPRCRLQEIVNVISARWEAHVGVSVNFHLCLSSWLLARRVFKIRCGSRHVTNESLWKHPKSHLREFLTREFCPWRISVPSPVDLTLTVSDSKDAAHQRLTLKQTLTGGHSLVWQWFLSIPFGGLNRRSYRAPAGLMFTAVDSQWWFIFNGTFSVSASGPCLGPFVTFCALFYFDALTDLTSKQYVYTQRNPCKIDKSGACRFSPSHSSVHLNSKSPFWSLVPWCPWPRPPSLAQPTGTYTTQLWRVLFC